MASGAFDKERLRREIGQDHKRKGKERLALLRAKIRAAIEHKKAICLEVKHKTRELRQKVRERIKAMRERARAKLNEIATRHRTQLRDQVRVMRIDARKSAANGIQLARLELKAERHWQREMARLERNHVARSKAHPHASYLERRSESDDLVRANLPPDHRALFEKVKSRIKGSRLQSRTEAFLRYAEAHPHELLEAIEHDAVREVRRLEAAHWKEQQAQKPPRRARPTKDDLAEAVPF